MSTTFRTLALSDVELHVLGAGTDLPSQVRALLEQQKKTWPLLRSTYASLHNVRVRALDLEGFEILLQHNPARLSSSTALVDADSIKARPCFLCADRLPAEQRAILFAGRYHILCNPYPIVHAHLTIANRDHVPQAIEGSVGDMLDLTRSLQPLFVVYNGPASGASAPDHMHFQAGERGSLPLIRALPRLLDPNLDLHIIERVSVIPVDLMVARFFALVSDEAVALERAILFVRKGLDHQPGCEPMMNITAWFSAGVWTVIVFPRAKHRPSMYYADGTKRFLLSPAAIDCMGLCVVPRAEDFDRLTPDMMKEMFAEILPSRAVFQGITGRIASMRK